MGVSAAVGSTYNYCGLLNNRLLQAYKNGDMEAALKECCWHHTNSNRSNILSMSCLIIIIVIDHNNNSNNCCCTSSHVLIILCANMNNDSQSETKLSNNINNIGIYNCLY